MRRKKKADKNKDARIEYINNLNKECVGNVAQNDVLTIQTMSLRNFERLQKKIADLLLCKLLNNQSLSETITRITTSYPRPKATKVNASKFRKRMMQYRINQTAFIYTGKNAMAGGQGIVKRGFITPLMTNPVYGVKDLFSEKYDNASYSAQRETKYNQMVRQTGPASFWFKLRNKANPTIVYPWIDSIPLRKVTTEDLQNFSFASRLECLISAFTDLDTLHKRFRIHGDAHPGNLIFNKKGKTLRLIDFGTVHKVATGGNFARYPEYMDPRLDGAFPNKQAYDMFTMGYAVAYMFPEILEVCTPFLNKIFLSNSPYYVYKLKDSDLTVEEQAIMFLIDALTEERPKDRPTCEQVINYCKSLLAHKNLNAETLQKILDDTINHKQITVEDILCGSKRALKFA